MIAAILASDPAAAAPAVVEPVGLFAVMFIFGFIICIVWVVFPFIVWWKLNRMILALEILNHNVRFLAKAVDDGKSAIASPKMGPEITGVPKKSAS
jgi:hypothetical protein